MLVCRIAFVGLYESTPSPLQRADIGLANLSHIAKLFAMKIRFNLAAANEDVRKLGIIAAGAGLFNGLFQQADPRVSITCAALGLLAIAAGNLQYNVTKKEKEKQQ